MRYETPFSNKFCLFDFVIQPKMRRLSIESSLSDYSEDNLSFKTRKSRRLSSRSPTVGEDRFDSEQENHSLSKSDNKRKSVESGNSEERPSRYRDEVINQPPRAKPIQVGGYGLRRREDHVNYAERDETQERHNSHYRENRYARDISRKRVRVPSPRRFSDSEDEARNFFIKKPEELIAETKPSKTDKDEVKPVDLMSTDWPDWSAVGGLSEQLASLKECAVLPLLYPSLFKFTRPPRGLLLTGPPGTGKTLAVRALAGTLRKSGCEVSLYCRKGADVLSKYVGEGERQLRLLFEAARKTQPAIIFFDEIDGLAPIRSGESGGTASAHHTSLVATLLALMDGLEDRGEQVIVLGATNRPDAIDPALRRPGRFDRELRFDPPANSNDRLGVLNASLRNWEEGRRPSEKTLETVAQRTEGWTGADLHALTVEAGMHAIRRSFPQLYQSSHRFDISEKPVIILESDFLKALTGLTPSARRVAYLSDALPPNPVQLVKDLYDPEVRKLTEWLVSKVKGKSEEKDLPDFFEHSVVTLSDDKFDEFPQVFTCSILPLALRAFVGHFSQPVAIVNIDQYSFDNSYQLRQQVFSAIRQSPALLLVHADCLIGDSEASRALKSALKTAAFPGNRVLVIIVGKCEDFKTKAEFLPEIDSLQFIDRSVQILKDFIERAVDSLIEEESSTTVTELPVLPPIRAKSADEIQEERTDRLFDWGKKNDLEISKLKEEEDHWCRLFRIQVREILRSLVKHPRFNKWLARPVDFDVYPDYLEIVTDPLCLADMITKNDEGVYICVSEVKADFDLIVSNAEAYSDAKSEVVETAREFRDAASLKLSCIDDSVIAMVDKMKTQAASRVRWNLSRKKIANRAKALQTAMIIDQQDRTRFQMSQAHINKLRHRIQHDLGKVHDMWDEALEKVVAIARFFTTQEQLRLLHSELITDC